MAKKKNKRKYQYLYTRKPQENPKVSEANIKAEGINHPAEDKSQYKNPLGNPRFDPTKPKGYRLANSGLDPNKLVTRDGVTQTLLAWRAQDDKQWTTNYKADLSGMAKPDYATEFESPSSGWRSK